MGAVRSHQWLGVRSQQWLGWEATSVCNEENISGCKESHQWLRVRSQQWLQRESVNGCGEKPSVISSEKSAVVRPVFVMKKASVDAKRSHRWLRVRSQQWLRRESISGCNENPPVGAVRSHQWLS